MGRVARMGEKRGLYSDTAFWCGKLKERTTRKNRCRWKDNIKLDLKMIVSDYLDWIQLCYGRDKWRPLAKTAINFRVAQSAGVLFD